jgi:predicted dehydrogenase
VLRLAGGALATLVVSDAAVSPWNYDLAAGESELYAPQPVDALLFSGTEGALSVPQLQHWHYRAGERHWHRELTREHVPLHRRDPYAEQLRHLRAVVEGREPPLCSAADGLATLAATLAVLQAAATGDAVTPAAGAAAPGGPAPTQERA